MFMISIKSVISMKNMYKIVLIVWLKKDFWSVLSVFLLVVIVIFFLMICICVICEMLFSMLLLFFGIIFKILL